MEKNENGCLEKPSGGRTGREAIAEKEIHSGGYKLDIIVSTL